MKIYTWKDIINIHGNIHAEEFPVTKKTDEDETQQINEFLTAIAAKYDVNINEIKTYKLHDINFEAKYLPFGAESCGYNIDSMPEWYYEL